MSGERRAVDAQRRLDLAGAGRSEGPDPLGGDPYAVGWLGQMSFAENGPRLESGIVVDAVPGAACYRVAAGRKGYVYCTPGGPDAAFGPSGARPTHTFPLFTRVFYLRDPETPSLGTIVAAEPHWSVHTADQPADAVWPFVRSGVAVEPAHRFPFEQSARVGASGSVNMEGVEGADASAGRPFDATTGGEWGRQTETGLGLFLDPWQVNLRVNEATGVFGFYDDSLLRVAAHNYQHFTSQIETEHLEDQGELYGHSRGTVYPWENAGLWRPNQVTPGWLDPAVTRHGFAGGQGDRVFDPLEVQAGSGYGVREPELAGQLAAARLYDWTGYLGQGGHRTVAAPAQLAWAYPSVPETSARLAPVGAIPVTGQPGPRLTVNGVADAQFQPYAVPANSYGGPPQPGLFEEHRTLSGRLTIRTARGILLAKRPSIPVPRPVRQPADPYGDRAATAYAASGIAGSTAAHQVRADYLATTNPLRRACVLPDAVAYSFNWENLHPFAYHALDWSVAEEGAAGTVLRNQRVPDYGLLAAAQYLAAPTPQFVDVDHRYGFAPVYENESIFGLLDDGSVVIRDGWGSEILMGGGTIRLRAAADVELHAGRDVQTWAGYDVILKAHNSIDASAANGDIRTKAERNSHHLAGNSKIGGFLFESKAECAAHNYEERGQGTVSSGFVVRCKESQVDVEGADVRVALHPDAPDDARVTLDAGLTGSLFTRAKQLTHKVTPEGAVVYLFDGYVEDLGDDEEEEEEEEEPVIETIAAHEWTATRALWGTDVVVNGQLYATTCVTSAGKVRTNTSGAVAGVEDRIEYLTGDYAEAFAAQAFQPPAADLAEFAFRTDEEYKALAYTHWRSHWEALAAADHQFLTPWTEPPVLGTLSAAESLPFPGVRWTAAGSYAFQNYTLVNPATGLAASRVVDREVYETGSPPLPVEGKLASLYKVVVPPFIPAPPPESD